MPRGKTKLMQVLYSGLGGHGNIAFSIIEGDIDRKCSHSVLFYGIEPVIEGYIEKCKKLNISFKEVIKKEKAHFASFVHLYKSFKKENPDFLIIHSSNALIPASFFCLFRHTKLIFTEHQPNEIKSAREWLLSFWAMVFAKKVVLNSTLYQKNLKKKLGLFFRKEKVKIIPNGLDLNKFRPKKRPDDPIEFKIGMASRLVRTKDHKTLIRAFSRLLKTNPSKRISLFIMGEGKKRRKLEALTENLELDDDITFTGLLNEKQLIDKFEELDLYVHATSGETMSTSIMQALACGLPMIVSDIPGTRHMLINKKTALLVAPKDPEKLFEAMQDLIKNPDKRRKLSKNARQYAEENFSMQNMTERYLNAFQR